MSKFTIIYRLKNFRVVLDNWRKVEWENDVSRLNLYNFALDSDRINHALTGTKGQFSRQYGDGGATTNSH
ncbi:MAG: hypothetical protein ACI9H8_000336 [Lysobacterales bacterium]|jgi:hypothetical protein